MPAIPNIINMVAGINQRKRSGQEREALSNYLNDPDGSVAAVMEVNPDKGIAMEQYRKSQEAAEAAAKAARIAGGFKYLRGMPEGTDYSAALDGMGGFLGGVGYQPEDVEAMKGLVSQPGFNPQMLDDDAWKAYVEDQYTTSVMTPGSHALRGGEVLHEVPYQYKSVTTRGGDGSARTDVFDPNTGQFAVDGPPTITAPGAAPAPAPAPEEGAPIGPSRLVPGRASGEQMEQLAVSAVPGINVTSRERTPERNRAVGGTEDSYHLTTRGGRARDFTPPPGMSMGQLASQLKQAYGRGWDVIDEGDHVHVEPGPGGGGAMPPTAQQTAGRTSITMPGRAPKPVTTYRTATPQELAGYPAGTAAQVDSNGKLVNVKTPPASAQPKPGEDGAKAEKRSAVSGTLGQLVNSYTQLDELNGITDPADGALDNLGASISSSWLGQTVGGMFGTETQSTREMVNNIRPLLIQQIREATGMSARAMDSNRELDFYLQAATDPKKDLISNLAAIQVLDSIYGNGTALAENLDADTFERVRKRAGSLMKTKPITNPGFVQSGAPEVGAIVRGYRFKGGDPKQQSSWEKVQ